VNKHKHIIVLNGQHYNAKTGENVSHPARPAAKTPAATHRIPVHTEASHRATHKPPRHPAGHVKAHSPKPAQTLMRHAVKKPSGSLKRHIRVQGHLDSQIKQPDIPAPPAQIAKTQHHAAKGRKVHLITHFSPNLFTTVTHATVITRPATSTRPVSQSASKPTMKPVFAGAAPKKPRTTAELLDYAIRYADSPLEPEEPVRRKHARKHRRTHSAAH
jgi:hypothetical protein